MNKIGIKEIYRQFIDYKVGGKTDGSIVTDFEKWVDEYLDQIPESTEGVSHHNNMKTTEEVLNKTTYKVIGKGQQFWSKESILKAMEEYASQFQSQPSTGFKENEAWIEQRIRDEYNKYKESSHVDFIKTAAIKIANNLSYKSIMQIISETVL